MSRLNKISKIGYQADSYAPKVVFRVLLLDYN